MGMRVDIVTLFPEMCQQVLDASIIGRAAKKGFIETHCHQIRDSIFYDRDIKNIINQQIAAKGYKNC